MRREGYDDLADAAEAGVVSAFAIAVALGWRKRPAVIGSGSANQARRRQFWLDRLLRD